MDGLKVAEANLAVRVHPSKSKRIHDAVAYELSTMLFKFDETFDGVVLAYEPNVRSIWAKILPGVHPYLEVKLKAKLLLFRPMQHMFLEGEVIKLSQQSIHVIVLGFASGIIAEEDICEDLKYKNKHDQEFFVSRSHKKHKIKVGTFLRFSVKSFDEERLHISGSLVPAQTGCIRWLERHSEERLHYESSSKKRTIASGEIEEVVKNEGAVVKTENDDVIGSPNKKRKKRKNVAK